MNTTIGQRKQYGKSKKRGLFPWRPRFPSRVTKAWDEWYYDWVINSCFKPTKNK